MSKVGEIRSYIPVGRNCIPACGLGGRYLAGLLFVWPETSALRKDSGLPQLTHEPTELRKKFVMECYSSFGLISAVLRSFNTWLIRKNCCIIVDVVVLRSLTSAERGA